MNTTIRHALLIVFLAALTACSSFKKDSNNQEKNTADQTAVSAQDEPADSTQDQAALMAEMKARQEAEAARQAAAEKAKAEAEAKARAEAEKARAEAEKAAAMAKQEAEMKARQEAEAARQAAAEKARAQGEEKARAEAEKAAAMAKQEAEMKARQEAEAARQAAAEKAKAEAEAKARAEAEKAAAMAKQEAEMKARQEAEAARQAAEEKVKAEAEKARAQAEEKARAEAQKAAAAAAAVAATAAKAATNTPPPSKASIADLGNTLTPLGAEKAGTADGLIPAWTGGITKPPAGYKPGDHHPNPFPNDKPKFVITGQNYTQYADKLTPGQIAMFKKYPDSFRMPIYQSRRSTAFPQRTYDMTIKNARTGKLVADGEGVADVAEGFPFPLPYNTSDPAKAVIWNHKMKYKGYGGVRYNNQAAPTSRGAWTLIKLREELLGKYWKPGMTLADLNNILLYFYQEVEAPARLAGSVLLVHETLNQKAQPRQAWVYNPGQRRVRRAPNVAYDNPGTASDGLRTSDMTDMFNGAMDRFDWKLVGKKIIYIPYNAYKLHAKDVDFNKLVTPHHLNPDFMRYEPHRVWVVEATLKPGKRHINKRRTYYLDEDSWQIVLTDHYDKRGQLWRYSEGHPINYYDVPLLWTTIETHNDLQNGRYLAVGLDNHDPVNTFNQDLNEADFTPQALRKRGRR